MRSFERSILFADRQPRSFVVASEPASTAMVRKPDVTSDENSAEANCAISRSPRDLRRATRSQRRWQIALTAETRPPKSRPPSIERELRAARIRTTGSGEGDGETEPGELPKSKTERTMKRYRTRHLNARHKR
jgi:hypothetical protein